MHFVILILNQRITFGQIEKRRPTNAKIHPLPLVVPIEHR